MQTHSSHVQNEICSDKNPLSKNKTKQKQIKKQKNPHTSLKQTTVYLSLREDLISTCPFLFLGKPIQVVGPEGHIIMHRAPRRLHYASCHLLCGFTRKLKTKKNKREKENMDYFRPRSITQVNAPTTSCGLILMILGGGGRERERERDKLRKRSGN